MCFGICRSHRLFFYAQKQRRELIELIKCTFDIEKFKSKPDKEAAKRISNRIAKYPVELTIEEIGKKLVQPNGCTFTPGVFTEGKRRIANWKSQQIFGLDFDEGLTIEEVLERCEKYNLLPAIIYTTFSSVNDNKFRVLFVLENEVTDFRIQKLIQLALMRIFSESDKACKDCSRVFYGGQELKHLDNTAVFNGALLVQEMCRYISDTDKAHAAREIKNYCSSVGLDMVNGLPKILPVVDEEVENMSKFGDSEAVPIDKYIIIGVDTKSPKYEVYFSKTNTSPKGAAKEHKYNIVNQRVEREELIRNFDFDELKDSCALYRDFLEQKYKLEHGERMGLATNLCCIKGGRKKFLEILEKGNEIHPDRYCINEWEYQTNYFNKMNYQPMQCSNFCPYADGGCEHGKNLIEQVMLTKGTVRVLEDTEYKTMAQAEKELREHFNRAMLMDDNKIYVIKAPTGLGKTELYLDAKNATIALPTHKLKQEVSERMHIPHTVTPPLPDDSILKYLYSVGSYAVANKRIKEQAESGNQEYIEYLKSSRPSNYGTLLTTHDKLLSLDRPGSTIIIDEDIISSLMPINTTTLEDLHAMAEQVSNMDTRDTLTSLYNYADSAGLNLVTPMPSYGGIKTSKLESYILADKISTNVLGFLNCEFFVKHNTDSKKSIINYICKRNLPEKQKIIILSATANESIYKWLFGDRVEFIDIGNVEPKGRLEQYPQRSYSRFSLDSDEKLAKIAKALTVGSKVITYKSKQEEFNAVATFGATEGLDMFKGENIAVIGTPHVNPITYILLANALGKKPRCNDTRTTMQYTKVKRNGYEFYFNTFSNDESLREIQLFLIESELIQAVGRARILRNNCTVKVLSNLPLQGAEFSYLTKQEIESILTA